MTLKRVIAKNSKFNGFIYYGEALVGPNDLHILFSAKSKTENGTKIFTITNIVDVNGNKIESEEIENEIKRGF